MAQGKSSEADISGYSRVFAWVVEWVREPVGEGRWGRRRGRRCDALYLVSLKQVGQVEVGQERGCMGVTWV